MSYLFFLAKDPGAIRMREQAVLGSPQEAL